MSTTWFNTFDRTKIVNTVLRMILQLPTGEDASADFVQNLTTEIVDILHTVLMEDMNSGFLPYRHVPSVMTFATASEVTGSDDLIYTCKEPYTSPNYSIWAAATTYSEGDLVIPASFTGFYYQAQGDGDSGGSEPTFPTYQGGQVVDNEVTWKAIPDPKPVTGKVYLKYWEQYGDTGGSYAANTFYNSGDRLTLDNTVEGIVSPIYIDSSGECPLKLIPVGEFNNICKKQSETQQPIYICFFPGVTPYIRVWPAPSDSDAVIKYDAITIFNDMLDSDDTAQGTENFPARYIDYVTFKTAHRATFQNPVPAYHANRIKAELDVLTRRVRAKDQESKGDFRVQPN